MSVTPLHRPRRGLTPLAGVTIAAAVFAILLLLVRLRWAPLESVDHGAAARINDLVAGNSALVTVVKAVTWLGSDGVLWAVVGVAAVILAIRKRWRLAAYLLVTGRGRPGARPGPQVAGRPAAPGGGASDRPRHRGQLPERALARLDRLLRGDTAGLPARGARPVAHRVRHGDRHPDRTDRDQPDPARACTTCPTSSAAWAIGITWLGITAFAFEAARHASGQRVTDPVTEGLEPEARTDLRPAQPEPACGRARHRGRIAAGDPGGLGPDRGHRDRPRRADHQARKRQRAR